MKILLDTHTFLWWVTDSDRLSGQARDIMSTGENDLFLSAASGWEIAIKAGLGKLDVPDDLEAFMGKELSNNAIEVLPIRLAHALDVKTLPQHHRDPFDRMLVAQSRLEHLPILSADRVFEDYQVNVIW